MLFAWSRRRSLLHQAVALLAVWTLSAGVAWAQQSHPATHAKPADTKPAADAAKPASTTPPAPPAPTKPAESAMRPGEDILRPPSDPVVAIVEGHMIYLSDVGRAVPQLPENLRGLPFQTLFPVVLDRLIDHQALVQLALREHLDNDPVVRREIQDASDRILEGALLSRVATPQASEEAIQAQYTKQYVGKPAAEEVRARHILVSTRTKRRTSLPNSTRERIFRAWRSSTARIRMARTAATWASSVVTRSGRSLPKSPSHCSRGKSRRHRSTMNSAGTS